MPSRYRFGDLLAFARRSWIRQVTASVEAAGFPGYRQSDAGALRLLARGATPIGRLGEALGVTRQTARQLAGGLVDRGYARFGSDPGDARRRLVVLTAEGEAYARAVWRAQDELNDAVQARVGARDLEAADTVLRAVFSSPRVRARLEEWMPPPRQ